MSFMDDLEINSEPIKSPYLGILYGSPGAGKSWLCTYAEKPFYVSLEHGTEALSVPRFKNKDGSTFIPKTSDELFETLRYMITAKDKLPEYKTVVLDSLRFAETLFYMDIVEKNPFTEGKNPKPVKSVEDLGFSGYAMVMPYFEKLVTFSKVMRSKGKNVIFISHSHLVNFTSPDGKSYKQCTMALQSFGNNNVPELLSSNADWCFHIDGECKTVTQGSGQWQKNVALNKEVASIIVTTRRTSLLRNCKARAINENNIEDVYIFDRDSRDEVSKQIFADLEK
jgi:hypothetical protein